MSLATFDDVYVGSDIAEAVTAWAAAMPATATVGADTVPVFLALGLAEESSAQGPPRVVWDEDDRLAKGCDFADPAEQPEHGHAFYEAREYFWIRVWGRSKAEADALRNASLNALQGLGSRRWAFEIGKAFQVKPKVQRQGYGWNIEVALYAAISYVDFTTVSGIRTASTGEIVSSIDPVDPSPDPIPGLEN